MWRRGHFTRVVFHAKVAIHRRAASHAAEVQGPVTILLERQAAGWCSGWDGSIDKVTADASNAGIPILGLVSRRQDAVEPALGLRAVELLLRGVVERVRVATAVGVVARHDAVALDAAVLMLRKRTSDDSVLVRVGVNFGVVRPTLDRHARGGVHHGRRRHLAAHAHAHAPFVVPGARHLRRAAGVTKEVAEPVSVAAVSRARIALLRVRLHSVGGSSFGAAPAADDHRGVEVVDQHDALVAVEEPVASALESVILGGVRVVAVE